MKTRRLNIQGLAIKEPRVVSNIISEPGKVFICRDLISGEPTITSMLSGCPYYTYATYTGIGVKPYWARGVLMVSDIYLMYASCNPITAAKVKELFDPDEWMRDPEIVKAKLKNERKLCKVVVLAASYGCGKTKLNIIFKENGFNVSRDDSDLAYESYWLLFKQIKCTIKNVERLLIKQGYLINYFGYKVTPVNTKDAFNYLCQSSVSGLINYYMQLIFEKGQHLQQRFVTCIHDSLITELPEENVEASDNVNEVVLAQLNSELGWNIPVRFDRRVGKTFAELK